MGAGLAAVGAAGTVNLDEGQAPEWTFGTPYPIGAPPPAPRAQPGGRRPPPPHRSSAPCPGALPAAPPSARPAGAIHYAGAALLAVYGFGVAAMWISKFADEIVGLLQFLGLLRWVPPPGSP